ncbi:ribonuclease domain-containing protein [Azoarcus taiwanensis]|uniref:Ribonuclease n=1 Tax=Azoarcus taiwanensis TaxID=666964 RepID=A0A972J7L2_9RHOO|nr:ribonuclease domain-containing protein [Azoarcus taiwanensis]NMG01836.1 ribonuclease [Azoarcus taiwanensis]
MIRSRALGVVAVVAALAYAAIQGHFPGLLPTQPGQPVPTVSQPPANSVDTRAARFGVPREAIHTLDLIFAGGPFPYRQDGTTFQNRERLLPQKPLGFYREYTIETPGSSTRGARRWVTGGDPPEVFYYTDDHYRSFRQIEVRP